MIVISGWDNFISDCIDKDLSIVCFGAGMMGVYIEQLFIRKKLWSKVSCFLDNDSKKWGTEIGNVDRKPIYSVDKYVKISQGKHFIILVTCVTFTPIIEQLSKVREWEDIHCYIYPYLNYDIVNDSRNYKLPFPTDIERIPKVIHYCWFGPADKGELERRCIDSWKTYCPDYEIIEWNENNYDVSRIRYVREAYENRKWAYVTDYVRLDILYQYGGIYFDTDVELLKNIDPLLYTKAFIAYGEWPTVNSGAGIGTVGNNPIIKEMRDNPRSYISFLNSDGSYNMIQNCFYEAAVLEKYGFSYDFRMQNLGDILVLSPEYIATASIIGTEKYITSNTFAVHHNSENWADEKRVKERMQTLASIKRKSNEIE